MKPGLTTCPPASSTRAPSRPSPTALMRPPVMATSAGRPAEPVPSTTVPPRITMSALMAPSSQPGRHRARGRLQIGRVGSGTVVLGPVLSAGRENDAPIRRRTGVSRWRFGGSSRRRSLRPTTSCRSPVPSSDPPTGHLRSPWSTPATPRTALASCAISTPARSARARPSAWSPQFHHGGRSPAALRRVRQRRRARSRRSGIATDLGRQHPRLLCRGRHVLAGECPAGRAARLAGDQPQPARLRGERSARVAGRLHREPGQPGHGDRAQGGRGTGRSSWGTPWAAPSPSSSPTTTHGGPSG